MFPNDKKHSLYFVLTGSYCRAYPVFETAQAAIYGGIDILQLRQKNAPRQELMPLACRLAAECRRAGVIFIINDDPELALACGATGLHLGQEDISKHPLKSMRALLGAGKIIGVSTHNLAQLEAANGEDIDYAAFGPLYETKTKSYSIGDSELKAALALSAKPLVCIGGINSATLPGVLEKGGRHIAVISAIASASDPAAAARQIKRRIYEADHQRQARGSV